MSMTRFLYLLMDVLQGYPLFSDSLFSFPGEYFVKKKKMQPSTESDCVFFIIF